MPDIYAAVFGALGALVIELFRIARAANLSAWIPRPSVLATAEVLIVSIAAASTFGLAFIDEIDGPIAATVIGAAVPLLLQSFGSLGSSGSTPPRAEDVAPLEVAKQESESVEPVEGYYT